MLLITKELGPSGSRVSGRRVSKSSGGFRAVSMRWVESGYRSDLGAVLCLLSLVAYVE